MNRYEIGLKLLLDLLMASASYYVVDQLLDVPILSFFISIGIAHTLNWLLNGHIFVLLRYIWPQSRAVESFPAYVKKMKARLGLRSHVDGVAIYGSYCRGAIHEYSDLDVRVIVPRGVASGCLGALYCLAERLRAFFCGFPLDIYCCVDYEGLETLREDGDPVIIIDKSGGLARKYTRCGNP